MLLRLVNSKLSRKIIEMPIMRVEMRATAAMKRWAKKDTKEVVLDASNNDQLNIRPNIDS